MPERYNSAPLEPIRCITWSQPAGLMSDPKPSARPSSVHEGSGFAFAAQPLMLSGAETIVNPERRGVSNGAIPAAAAGSSLWQKLFPSESSIAADLHVETPGITLGHFVIEERIGMGGMGAVFRALDTRLQRIVALKVLSPAQSRDPAAVHRFQNEARAAARLDHDNIARVHFIGEDEGLHFIAFEYVTGTNLRDLIRENGPLHPAEAVNYALQIAAALKHTSAAGVVHRDIKPSNIIVAPNGRAKLVDLGLARKLTTDSLGELTIAGTTLGTFDYISPEQAKDPRSVDVRSDIYSLGCTLYHLLTGEPPYPEGTVLQKLLDHQGKEPPDPALKNRRVPPELSMIVQRMMASDPRRRYASAEDLMADLMPLAGAMGLRGFPPDGLIWASPRVEQESFVQRHLGWIATAAALLLIVLFIERFPGIWQEREAVTRGELKTEIDAERTQDRIRESAAARSGTTPLHGRPSSEPPINAGISSPPDRAPSEPDTEDPVEPFPPPGSRLSQDGSSDPGPPFGFRSLLQGLMESVMAENPPGRAGASQSPQGEPPSNSEPAEPRDAAIADRSGDIPELNPASTRAPSVPTLLDESRPFWIISSERASPESKPTLEAACAAAKDGNIIELRYNGRRSAPPEKPVRIANKKLTVRAADGFRPIVEFAVSGDAVVGERRMFSLVDGSVDLINVDLVMHVPREADVLRRSALISLEGTGAIRLQGVRTTIENPFGRPAAMVELVSEPSDVLDMRMMDPGPGSGQPAYKVEVTGSLLRGACDLFAVEHTGAGRIDVQQSGIAVERSLLYTPGVYDTPDSAAELEIQLSHATCLVGHGLLRIDSGSEPRSLVPIYVSSARNNIFSTNTPSPFVAMSGNSGAEDFRRLFRWNGERNFYDGFASFWVITSDQGTTDGFEPRNFEGWKREWARSTSTGEVDAQSGGITWKDPWFDKELPYLTVSDLALDRSDLANAAVSAATDGTDAGADLSQLPQGLASRSQ